MAWRPILQHSACDGALAGGFVCRHVGPAARPGVTPLPDTDALNRFFAGAERRAYRMARIATASPDDALDLVQEAMLRLTERYGERPAAEWGPLFQRILQNGIRDWHRRTRVRERLRNWLRPSPAAAAEGDPLDRLAAPGCTPEQALVQADAVAALEAALRALPLRQQQAFMLRAWEGYDTAGTARAMGCSQGSVKTHYSRALASLRAALGEHWR